MGSGPAAPPRDRLVSGLAGALNLVLLDDHGPQRLGRRHPDGLAPLLGPFVDPPLDALDVADLAPVRAQRSHLPIDRRADVDPGVGTLGPEQVEPPNLV